MITTTGRECEGGSIMNEILKVIDFRMKRLFLLLPIFLASCNSTPKASDYSFELINNVISGSMEIEDTNDEYSAECSRTGDVTWEVNVVPKEFTGLVTFNGSYMIGDLQFGEQESSETISLKGGKMLSKDYDFYSYAESLEERNKEDNAVCSMKSESDFYLKIDSDTLIMLPGVHPGIAID